MIKLKKIYIEQAAEGKKTEKHVEAPAKVAAKQNAVSSHPGPKCLPPEQLLISAAYERG